MTKHLKMQTTNSHHQPPKCMLKPPTTKKPDLEEGKKPATTMTYQKLPTTTSHCLKIRALNHKSEHKTTSNPQIRTLNHQISTNPTKPLQKPSKRKQKKTLTNLDQKPKTQKLRSKLKNLQGSEIKRRWDERSPLPLVVVAGRSRFGGARPWRLCWEREREREKVSHGGYVERERWSAMMVVADENLGKGMVPRQCGWWGVRCKKFYTCFKCKTFYFLP